jgi:hypothetical protein
MILNKNAQAPQSKKISAVRYKKGAYIKKKGAIWEVLPGTGRTRACTQVNPVHWHMEWFFERTISII